MITNRGNGKIESHLYLIKNKGVSRLIELHIGAVVMEEGGENSAVYFGKAVVSGGENNSWSQLKADSREEALKELKEICDKSFNK
ncbi:hypothetical protein [Neobacillus niacini]|uniref:hypothetical protein n=1 Tax=Neobacillus niacini TaxID=86668 RepID=UPI001C8E0F4A|nr:hypothetical protein [Neobacillus niacini]MBY0148848.1 hypothetical protein [Neobacillus niacini]